MAFGPVNVPSMSRKELDRIKKTADDAKVTANAAKETADKAAKDVANINKVIESGGGIGGNGGSNTIKITFEAAFAGADYTVTDGEETVTGTVPEGLVVSVKVSNCNSTYTIRATANNGVEYSTDVATGAYYGQYTATLAVFNAVIHVTAAPGAEVTAVTGGSTFTAVADSGGAAVVQVNRAGTYTITAVKENVSSNSAEVVVENEADTHTATVRFIVLEVTSPVGSVLTIRRKD